MNIEQLLQRRSDIWRGDALVAAGAPGMPTGFAKLDAELPGGGWPVGALSEILSDDPGSFALTLPALARQGAEARWSILLQPPYLPYAPALAGRGVDLSRLLLVRPDRDAAVWWAAEQGLRSRDCGAVLIWGEPDTATVVRRLQLAAEEGNGLAFLFRSEGAAGHSSPAALRLQVRPTPTSHALEVRILKRRGGRLDRPLALAV
jgi:cell division inhibitor SulA/protein ImuA